jgi:hypothetical protein
MATEDDLRRLALGLASVTERPCYGTPAFYVAGKIFARVHEQPGVVVLWRESQEERQALLESEPDAFFLTDHYRGTSLVLARLAHLDEEELAELLAESWETRAPARLRRA